jgi:hypothetical protein
MNRWLPVLCVGALLLGARIASPTTVIAPTFDELVAKAQTIFVGRAVDTRSEFEYSSSGRSIVTHVTFSVERVLKGQVGLQTELTFLGGTVGDIRMEVAGMPEFRVGDRDLLFVSSQVHAASPLVGLAYGRFRLVRDPVTGADQVRTHDGRPVVSIEDIGKPPVKTLKTLRPMAFTEFESIVRQRAGARR